MQHKVNINVANASGENTKVLTSKYKKFSTRLFRLLFGDFSEVIILNPGKTVQTVEIKEVAVNA